MLDAGVAGVRGGVAPHHHEGSPAASVSCVVRNEAIHGIANQPCEGLVVGDGELFQPCGLMLGELNLSPHHPTSCYQYLVA